MQPQITKAGLCNMQAGWAQPGARGSSNTSSKSIGKKMVKHVSGGGREQMLIAARDLMDTSKPCIGKVFWQMLVSSLGSSNNVLAKQVVGEQAVTVMVAANGGGPEFSGSVTLQGQAPNQTDTRFFLL